MLVIFWVYTLLQNIYAIGYISAKKFPIYCVRIIYDAFHRINLSIWDAYKLQKSYK